MGRVGLFALVSHLSFANLTLECWRGDEDTELFFASHEIEVIESPFAYWNALKSSRDVGEFAHVGVVMRIQSYSLHHMKLKLLNRRSHTGTH
ncbi:hypothetical protein KMB89_gp09 [Citrobacter phage HCF1]|uniref:Secreted protein n=1 Tax=Citrobacter phage HCF1 TaxID=2849700 RepID=A0ABX6D465_9CAUD|nr:hypothetical protein KMB89_gp09 [Citrobacter phage HCF1]